MFFFIDETKTYKKKKKQLNQAHSLFVLQYNKQQDGRAAAASDVHIHFKFYLVLFFFVFWYRYEIIVFDSITGCGFDVKNIVVYL